ncbi:Metal dependent phosphohydrolase, partial [mine drainage metagenome]
FGRSLAEKKVDGIVAEKKRIAFEIEAEAVRRKESIVRNAELEAREVAFKSKVQSEEEANQRRQLDLARDQALKIRESSMEELQKNLDSLKLKLEKDIEGLKARDRMISARESALEEMISLEHRKLEEISGLSLEESRERLLREAEDLIRMDISRSAQKFEREA